MSKYALINENRYNEFLNELELVYQDNLQKLDKQSERVKEFYFNELPTSYFDIESWSKLHTEKKWTGSERKNVVSNLGDFLETSTAGFTTFTSDTNKVHHYGVFEYRCNVFFSFKDSVQELKKTIHILKQTATSDGSSLDDYLTDDTLNHSEALFLILGLNPKSLESIPLECSINIDNGEMEPVLFIQKAHNSREFRILDKAIQANSIILQHDSETIDTKSFIDWAIEKSFFKESDNKANNESNSNPLGKYNDYRGWAKVHNTTATLVALEFYEGRLKSTSSILKDKVFYEKLSEKLVPKERDGKDKPKSKTLENYISEYNNPPEK